MTNRNPETLTANAESSADINIELLPPSFDYSSFNLKQPDNFNLPEVKHFEYKSFIDPNSKFSTDRMDTINEESTKFSLKDSIRVTARKVYGVPNGDHGVQYFLATPNRIAERLQNPKEAISAAFKPRSLAAGLTLAALSLHAIGNTEVSAKNGIDAEQKTEFVYYTEGNDALIPFNTEGQDFEVSKLKAAEVAKVDPSAIEIDEEQQMLIIRGAFTDPDLSLDKSDLLASYMAASLPDGGPIVPEKLEFEAVNISPEVQRLNDTLAAIDSNAELIDIAPVVEAVKTFDASFAPNDQDRDPAMLPEWGYVKLPLHHEAIGLNVPFTIAERTSDSERYGSPELVASTLVWAKMYQDIAAQLGIEGEMLRVRDLNSRHHNQHSNGRNADYSGSEGWEVTQYSDGSLADSKFSEMNNELTIELAHKAGDMVIAGDRIYKRIYFSDQAIVNEINRRAGLELAKKFDENHYDHFDATLKKKYELPKYNPYVTVWHEDRDTDHRIDLKIGGEAIQLTPEQHASQHADFEQYVAEQFAKIKPEKPVEEPANPAEAVITPEAEAIISQLELPEENKEFLHFMLPHIMNVYNSGRNINPEVLLAQTVVETGFGQKGELYKNAYNPVGIKASSNWKGPIFLGDTKEEFEPGVLTELPDAAFRKYPDIPSALNDYADIIENRSWYSDAAANKDNPTLYLQGLLHELDEQGNIVHHQGTTKPDGTKVSSYATDSGYEKKILDRINSGRFSELVAAMKTPEAATEQAPDSNTTTAKPDNPTTTIKQPDTKNDIVKDKDPFEVDIDSMSWFDKETVSAMLSQFFDQNGLITDEEKSLWVDNNLSYNNISGNTVYQLTINQLSELV